MTFQSTETQGDSLPEVLTAEEANRLQKEGKLTIVDIRTPMEWMRSGIPEGARPISVQDPGFLQELMTLMEGDRNRPIALICATGNRSAAVQRYLRENGFGAVANIAEGMMGNFFAPGWIRGGLPVSAYYG